MVSLLTVPRTAPVLLWAYCLAHAVTPVALAAGFLFALHLYGAVPVAPALVLAVGALIAHLPATIIDVLGGPKERAASRVYVGAFWTAIALAATLLIIADNSGQTGDWNLARQAGGIAALGVLTAMIAHVKAAAEVLAAPTYPDATDTTTVARLATIAAARTERARSLPVRMAHLTTYSGALAFLFASGCLPLIGANSDSALIMLALTAPTTAAAAGLALATHVRTWIAA